MSRQYKQLNRDTIETMKYPVDTSIRPQDDFFGHVNNTWLRANPIPPTESSWGTFYELRDNAADAVHGIMDELAAADDEPLTHDQRLIKCFYTSALNFDSFAATHKAYLSQFYHEIDAISSPKELARYLGRMHRYDATAFWSPYVDHDDKNSRLMVLRIHQSGLTMPNRDYYIDRSPHMSRVRERYQEFYHELQAHLGDKVPGDFTTIYNLENQLARAAWTNVKLRDIEKNYNRFTLAALTKKFAFDWDSYFAGLGWQSPSDNIVISQPSYLQNVMKLLQDTPLATIKVYLKWRTLMLLIAWLDQPSAEIAFRFFGTSIGGTKEMKPLWKRAVLQADSLIIGEAIGREYAGRHFPESSKQAVLSIVEDIRSAYHLRLDRLTWMGETTKQRAHQKLDAMKVLIGYPNIWKDLARLTFAPDNHLATIINAREYWSDIELAKVGQPPETEQWEMNAHTVNAYHHPNRLEIVFPAAILQPPFYDPKASYASNLGGIGAVIGHEFTHGFDDQGADFDEQGNTNRWQTPAERKAFDTLAEHIVTQADKYETVPGVFLQGKLILGEAIADIGGLQLAIEALRMKATEEELASQLQELFLTFARCECGHATTERLIELAKIDPHPPSPFRVNCVVGHTEAFYETYNVQPTDKLYIAKSARAHIW